jgi:hypothetical protein
LKNIDYGWTHFGLDQKYIKKCQYWHSMPLMFALDHKEPLREGKLCVPSLVLQTLLAAT